MYAGRMHDHDRNRSVGDRDFCDFALNYITVYKFMRAAICRPHKHVLVTVSATGDARKRAHRSSAESGVNFLNTDDS